ncbi:unnamed protein product [Linum tenue]|uniref:RNase H type-1 domain-containing protein n=1 Tax=Linum tenue TaxID=586396 RepID=A0AAV0RL10_9ROSI|nr:unnamed protein product [Linum tenue]
MQLLSEPSRDSEGKTSYEPGASSEAPHVKQPMQLLSEPSRDSLACVARLSFCQDWLISNLCREDTCLAFGLNCWSLWKTRNDRIFAGKVVSAEAFLQRVLAWIDIVKNAMDKDRLVHMPRLPARTEVEISWKPPPPEWVTLNTDGSVIQESGRASAGGLIRDHRGCCLAAFAMNLGVCSITRAELRGAMEGLQLAWNSGFRRVRLELDSQCAVLLLSSRDYPDHPHAAIIHRFQEMMQCDWEVTIHHVYREGNKGADFLANYGHNLPVGLHPVSCSVPDFHQILLYDCQGLSETRLVVNES